MEKRPVLDVVVVVDVVAVLVVVDVVVAVVVVAVVVDDVIPLICCRDSNFCSTQSQRSDSELDSSN